MIHKGILLRTFQSFNSVSTSVKLCTKVVNFAINHSSSSYLHQKRKMGALEDINQQIPDDDSSNGSFSLGSDDDHSILEDESITSSESDEPERDSAIQPTSTVSKLSSSNLIYEVAKLSYRDFSIGIFTDNEEEPRRFFFEPIVLLDPTTVSIESDHILKQNNLVRFKIKMWTKELRSKVLERLRFLNYDVELDDVSVMPYEELKLVVKPGSIIEQTARVVEETISYKRLSESIPFYFMCDSEDSATILADYLCLNTEITLERCKLALECEGLALSYRTISSEKSSDRPRATFDVSTITEEKNSKLCGMVNRSPSFINVDLPLSEITKWFIAGLSIVLICFLYELHDNLFEGFVIEKKNFKNAVSHLNTIQDTQGRLIQELIKTNQTSENVISLLRNNQDTQGRLIDALMIANKNSTNVVPVFSVKSTCGSATNNQYIPFSSSEFKTETNHGDFDLASGIFTVKTAGIYQLSFNSHVRLRKYHNHHFEIRVDGKRRAVSYISSASEGYHQVHLSALLHLYIGEKVGVFRIKGQLHGKPDSDFITTFSGILFS